MRTKLMITALAVAGLVASPLAAQAKSQSHSQSKHHKSSTTTGSSTKSNKATSGGMSSSPSSQGNVGPGTNNNVGGGGKINEAKGLRALGALFASACSFSSRGPCHDSANSRGGRRMLFYRGG
jgi:hypothetical protein